MNEGGTSDLRTAARAIEDAYLSSLASLVSIESPSHDRIACNVLADALSSRLQDDGWTLERHPASEVGDALVARHPGDDPNDGTLLLAHYDTVWPLGTLEHMPYHREGDLQYGPGTLDMKAGIANALHAVPLARSYGTLRGPVTLLISSDEEIGSTHSRALIEREARNHRRVLVLEPARDDGAAKVGRKGVGDVNATLSGVSAHAGLDPTAGASALRELAYLLVFGERLTDMEAGTTVNCTVASGGSAGNVISERATAHFDVRVLRMEEASRVLDALHGYTPHDARVSVTWSGGINRPPMEQTDANAALAVEGRRTAEALGLPWTEAVVGGGSDGNFTSALGIATLDGLGSVGGGAHARHEHIRIQETLDRVALVAGLLLGVGRA